MSNKKPVKPAGLEENYQELIEKYHESEMTPNEFVAECLQKGSVGGEEATFLLEYLSNVQTRRSYALADVSDERFFRFGLYETSQNDCENNPVFIMQLAEDLRKHEKEILALLETFSRRLAEQIFVQSAAGTDTDEGVSPKPQPPHFNRTTSEQEQMAMLNAWVPDVQMS